MVVKLSTMKKLNPILEKRAVDLYAHTPNIKHSEVAKQLEISDKTLLKLRKDGNFWDKVYSTFMQSFEGELQIYSGQCVMRQKPVIKWRRGWY